MATKRRLPPQRVDTSRVSLLGQASGEGYERLRRALEAVESESDPGAVQRNTKAIGFYQFIPKYWEGFSQEEFGRSIKSFLPENDTPEAIAKAAKDQREILFPRYYEKEMAPWIAATKSRGLGRGRSDLELAIMFHKLGDKAATDYLKTGRDASRGTKDNEPIEDYVRAVARKAMGASLIGESATYAGKWHRTQQNADIPFAPPSKYQHRTTAENKSHHQAAAAVSYPAAASMAGGDQRQQNNDWVLTQLQILNQQLGQGQLEINALNRIRIEGGGRAGI